MSYRSKIIKEWVDVNVVSAGTTVKANFEVDKHAGKIIGLALTSTFMDRLYFRGTQKISFNEMELYPEGYESLMLISGINVPVNERMVDLGEGLEPGNRRVDLEYTDNNHPSISFTPYRVRLYVFSQIDE